ncbi:uncharacterized protein LOC135837280 isoform X3 [Planococcus citri]|uniref:uncharacterized protein LOC135837280 isoform X3 n=1 Tax=Planococcus citri TaxID=170843 RepID=UPI0031FA1FDD
MNFVTCIIFIVWFSFAENVPVNETSSSKQSIDITENLTKFLNETFGEWMSNYHPRRYMKKTEFKPRPNEIRIMSHEFADARERPVHNITMYVNMSADTKFQIFFAPTTICPTDINIHYELGSASLKAYLGSNQYVKGDINPLHVNITRSSPQPGPGNLSAVIQNLDQIQFKPLDPEYVYWPSEDTRVKQAITKYLSALANESVNESIVRLYLSMLVQGIIVKESFKRYYEFKQCDSTPENQQQNWYYSIAKVSSTEDTLSNVTITGSWDLHSISADSSNQENFLTIQFTNVRGTMQKFIPGSPTKNPTELSFTAERVKAIADVEAGKMNIKFEDYSVYDAKSSTKLDKVESKSIVERIEAAIASTIPTRPPRPETPRTTAAPLPAAENTDTNSINVGKTVKQYFSTVFSGFFF